VLPYKSHYDELYELHGYHNNNNTQDNIYSAIIYGVKPYASARVHFGYSV